MPRFYFQVEGSTPDAGGVEIPTVTEAKCEAARFAGRMLCDEAEQFWEKGSSTTVTVSDEKGLTLFMVAISGIEAPAIRTAPSKKP